jgi:hypothetical protein
MTCEITPVSKQIIIKLYGYFRRYVELHSASLGEHCLFGKITIAECLKYVTKWSEHHVFKLFCWLFFCSRHQLFPTARASARERNGTSTNGLGSNLCFFRIGSAFL